MVTVVADRTGDKVMRFSRMVEAEASRMTLRNRQLMPSEISRNLEV